MAATGNITGENNGQDAESGEIRDAYILSASGISVSAKPSLVAASVTYTHPPNLKKSAEGAGMVKG